MIIDFVINHTSNEHPWFKAAADYIKSLPDGAEPDPSECPYVDYYNLAKPIPEATTSCLARIGITSHSL